MNFSNLTVNSTSSNWYQKLFYDFADPRVRNFVFFGDPVPILSCYIFYIILCRLIIPMAMKDQKSLKLKKFSLILNFLIFGISIYFLIKVGKFWLNYNLRCQPVDYSDEAIEVKLNFFKKSRKPFHLIHS